MRFLQFSPPPLEAKIKRRRNLKGMQYVPIEVVDDDTNKEIQNEERPNNNEENDKHSSQPLFFVQRGL